MNCHSHTGTKGALVQQAKNKMRNLLFILATVAAFTSCRSTRHISTAIAKKDTVVTDPRTTAKADSIAFMKSALQGLQSHHIEYTTFTAKVNIDYKDDAGKNYDVNATLRMYKDSAIWLSANAVLGIEAIRLLITKDSVKIIDKLNKNYTARSVDYLQEVTQLPLDLKTVQDLLIGNPVFLDTNIVSYVKLDESVILLSVGSWFKNLLTLNASDKSLERSKLDDADVTRLRSADLYYSDYENKDNVLFATNRRIIMSEKKKLDIKVDFKQYGFNGEVSFPFSIPKNYTRN
jgi:hypothetical protein